MTSRFDGASEGGSLLETRVAKFEASVEHIANDISDIKGERKTLRSNT